MYISLQKCLGNIFYNLCFSREEAGMFVQKPNYKTSMRKIASVQSKIEGWEVSVRINVVHVVL